MRGVRALTQKLALNLASIFIVSGSDESRVPQMIDFPGSRCPDVANTPTRDYAKHRDVGLISPQLLEKE
jgi:hypothetical protein